MRMLNFMAGIIGFVLSLIVMLVSWQTLFAGDAGKDTESSAEVIYKDEKFGLARFPIQNVPNDTLEELSIEELSIKDAYGKSKRYPKALVYAAYTSYTESNSNDSCWPWLYPDKSFLFVTFKVTDNTRVNVKWKVKGPNAIGDSFDYEGEILDKNFWYYAWLQPTSLTKGLYTYTVTVKPVNGSGKTNGKPGKDSCKFEILEILEE